MSGTLIRSPSTECNSPASSPSTRRRPRILHIEPDPLWGDVVGRMLETRADLENYSRASTGSTAVALCSEHRPQVIVLELQLPDIDGYALLERLRSLGHPVEIVLLTRRTDDYTMYQIRKGAVRALVVKTTNFSCFLPSAIAAVLNGRSFLCATGGEAMRRFRCNPVGFQKILSEHEIEFVSLFALGTSDAEISAERQLSRHTVHAHRTRIMAKLEVSGTKELVRWAAKAGFRT